MMNGNFTKGKLQKNPFAILPLGAVRPKGWLADQLDLQRNGIFDDMERYPFYGEQSAWRGGSGEDWEDGPYYLRGLVAMAYLLGDPALIDRAKVWIEAILSSQREDGTFGPATNDDWWPRMPALMALRDYFEATERAGEPDMRVIPFIERYFRAQLRMLPEKPLYSWGKARGGDNLEVVLWLYDRLYREDDPEAVDWLLDLCDILRKQTTDWVELMDKTTVRTHVVNTSQAMKTPPLWYLISGDERDRKALSEGLEHISIDHGRVDGLPNSDEAARDNLSIRGSELCGIVEGMFSTELGIAALGERWLCDRLERLAYNALPTAYAPDYSGHVYFILQNQALATTGYHEFDCDHGDSSAFGAPCGFECCFANNSMGWPKFVQSMWMASRDGGLMIAAYGPSSVDTPVEGGRIARFDEETEYPFRDRIVLTYHGEEAEFPLWLPIPGWCKSPRIVLNGEPLDLSKEGGLCRDGFVRLDRTFAEGDVLEITLQMEIDFSEWYNRSVALTRGPLIYSLKIGEDWREYSGNEMREIKTPIYGRAKKQEVYPLTRWNYALLPDPDRVRVETRPLARQPFFWDSAPISLYAVGQAVPGWKLDGNHVGAQPFGGVLPDGTAQREIELIPYGAARLKITHFPRITPDPGRIFRDDPVICERDGRTVQEFRNIFLPMAADYSLIVHTAAPSAEVRLYWNGVEVEMRQNRAENLKNLSEWVKFGSCNTVTAVGDPVSALEILPIDPVSAVLAESVEARPHGITVNVNLSRTDYGYELDFGQSPDALSRHFRRFGGKRARIGGLEPDRDYFFRLSSFVDGRRIGSEVYAVHTPPEGEGGESIPSYQGNFAPECFDEFGDPVSERVEDWLSVGSTRDYKALLRGGEGWKDYEVQARICLRRLTGDAGLIFCVADPAAGADSYRGFYFGITPEGAVLGSANGSWHPISVARFAVEADRAYLLSAKVGGGQIVCAVDGEVLFRVSDSHYRRGSVGLRCYGAPFAAEYLKVRPLEPDEIAEMAADCPPPTKLNISATSAFETVQVTFNRIPGADSYRIDYGSSSGYYQNVIADIPFNPFKGSAPFTLDKTAFTYTGTTCYLQMSAWQGDEAIAVSDEISVDGSGKGRE